MCTRFQVCTCVFGLTQAFSRAGMRFPVRASVFRQACAFSGTRTHYPGVRFFRHTRYPGARFFRHTHTLSGRTHVFWCAHSFSGGRPIHVFGQVHAFSGRCTFSVRRTHFRVHIHVLICFKGSRTRFWHTNTSSGTCMHFQAGACIFRWMHAFLGPCTCCWARAWISGGWMRTIFWGTHTRFQVRECVFECTHGFSGVCTLFQVGARVFGHVHALSGGVMHFRARACIFKCAHMFSRMRTCFLACARIFG